jgi:hypothetical protein
MSFRILSISYDQNVLNTRQLLLEQRGYVVVSAFLLKVLSKLYNAAKMEITISL